MKPLGPSITDRWHAHVYFEASSREAAWALRETIGIELAGRMEMGRLHEKPVGPHPMWSYQLAFSAASFSHVVDRLALNHGILDVFVHPNTDDEVRTMKPSSDTRRPAMLTASQPLIGRASIST
jgi:aromatic ring-cleaving dioxygenase